MDSASKRTKKTSNKESTPTAQTKKKRNKKSPAPENSNEYNQLLYLAGLEVLHICNFILSSTDSNCSLYTYMYYVQYVECVHTFTCIFLNHDYRVHLISVGFFNTGK